jgi:hypothetical protein
MTFQDSWILIDIRLNSPEDLHVIRVVDQFVINPSQITTLIPSFFAITTAALSEIASAVEYVFATTLPGPRDKSVTLGFFT